MSTGEMVHGVHRILLTGGSGQVGYELIRALAPLGNVVAPTSRDLDLADADSIRRAVRATAPAVIVNAAAYTNVDNAEVERERCFAINARAPGILAEEAQQLGAALVHYSTDYVFDGTKRKPYTEDDAPHPQNVYGGSKLAGEHAIANVGGAYVILRTSWVYGARGTNFLRTIRRLIRERHELRVVEDQMGAPTWSRVIADTTALVIGKLLTADCMPAEDFAHSAGTYHLSADGQTSWYQFARAIMECDPKRDEVICKRLIPVTTAEYGAPAPRPLFSVLDNNKLRMAFGLSVPDWAIQLQLVLRDLA